MREGAIVAEMGRHNETYKENMALRCKCGVPVAEWLDLSAVGIAQLAHAADESILWREGWRRGSLQITLGFLVVVVVVDYGFAKFNGL